MTAYYNENDPFAAAWLRELIEEGAIAPGAVDERSIKNVQEEDLRGFSQCHFFAGIGAWSYALRRAGWPDDRFIWTGSCPCPSFSISGKGAGFSDARHLWPDWLRLIRECRPAAILGEQVDGAIAHGWLDLVWSDLEAEGYAIGAAVLGAASVGAPHRRQRLWFVAVAERLDPGGLEHAFQPGLERHAGDERNRNQSGRERADAAGPASETGSNDWVEYSEGRGTWPEEQSGQSHGNQQTSETFGPWENTRWLWCRDQKWRPVESVPSEVAPGLAADLGLVRDAGGAYFSPLIGKTKNRVGRLRGYGNAICAPVAVEFIKAYMEVASSRP